MLIYDNGVDGASKDTVWPMAPVSGEDQRLSLFIDATGLVAPLVVSLAPADAPTRFVQIDSGTAARLLNNIEVNGPVVIRVGTSGAGSVKVFAQ